MIATLTTRLSESDRRRIDAFGDVALSDWLRLGCSHPYYTFQPRPDQPDEFDEQSAFVNDRHSNFAICLGGNGSGKTMAAAYKTARYVLETMPMRERCPFWVVGEYFDQICNVAWVGKLSQFIPESEILDYVWLNHKRMWPRSVLLRHPLHRDRPGWIIEFRSYEQGIGAVKGDSIGGYWFNEEVPFSIVTEVRMRCRDYGSPGWADFTPVENKDVEWPECYENPPEGWTFYHLNTLKNDALPDGWFEKELQYIPEDLREMRTIGKFVTLQGAVYKEFRKKIHVIEPFRIPAHWPKWRSIDFGYNNAFCCLWFTRDHDGTIYVYDEHYESQRLLSYHAEKIKQREWDATQPWYGSTYADHDAQDCAELAAMGIPTTPAYKAIHHGIELTRSRMIVQGNGQPRLKIFDSCRNLIREIPGYKWQVGTDTRNPQDLPYGVDDHALDALRYGVATETLRGRGGAPAGRRVIRDSRRHGVHLEKRA